MINFKFRVWAKYKKMMFYDLSKIVFHFQNELFVQSATKIEVYREGEVAPSRFRGKDVEIMQYTGLKDCEGIEIYEGDIVSFFRTDGLHEKDKDETFSNAVVIMKANGDGVRALVKKDYCRSCRQSHSPKMSEERLGDVYYKNISVEGNIYENPSLIIKGALDD